MTTKVNVVYVSFFKFLSKFSTYILLLILGNLFIKSDYGEAVFILSWFQLIFFFSFFGLPDLYTAWILNKRDKSTIFYFLFLINLFLIVIGVVFSFKNNLLLPLALVLWTIFLGNIGKSILNSKHRYHFSYFFDVLYILVIILFLWLLKSYGKYGIVSSYALSFFIVNILIIYVVRKDLFLIVKEVQLKPKVISDYLKKGVTVSLLSISFLLLGWIDTIILGWLSTYENVAKYNIAGPISNVITLIPLSLGMFLLTRAAEEKNKKYSLGMFHRTLRISFSISLIAALLLNSFIFLIIKLFFPKYIEIEGYVMILSIGIVFFSIYNLIYMYLAGKLIPEKAFWPIFTAAMVNILLDIILIPKYGLFGIVSATTLAHGIALTWLLFTIRSFWSYLPVFILILLIPLSYVLRYYGILLTIPTLLLLFIFKLINSGDTKVIINTTKNLLKIK